MSSLLSDPSVALMILGEATLHFLWQGLVIWAVVLIVLKQFKCAETRYLFSMLGLLSCITCFLITFVVLAQSSTMIAIDYSMAGSAIKSSTVNKHQGHLLSLLTDSAMTWQTLAAWLWITGVILMSCRLIRQWLGIRRLRHQQVSTPSDQWNAIVNNLKRQMGIRQQVQFLESGLAKVPMVIGWLRPVILIPSAAFMNLTTAELRLVLAHELSHIRRHDHLINLAQALVEVTLFFHPVTWWLSRQIRTERENCCDDACLGVTGSPRVFAEALLKLELLRSESHSKLMLTATGGSLMNRITRLVSPSDNSSISSGWKAFSACTALVLACGFGATTMVMSSPATAQERSEEVRGAVFPSTESMKEGLANEIRQDNLNREQADMILRVHARLLKGIESGKLTTAEALEIMDERSIAIYEGEGRKTKVDAKSRYDEAVAKMTEMVKNGEMTREQMQQRLDRMKKEMGRERTITQKDYDEAVARMTDMVKERQITREQMKQRLDRMKKMMAKTKTFTQKEYDEAVAKMSRMVKNGEITREQMTQRLDRMKKMMAKDKTITREDIAKAQAEMKKMVEAGKLTEEQMRQKLGEMRRMMKKAKTDQADPRAAYERMQRRLDMAVNSGR